jgi:hypothetical protein
MLIKIIPTKKDKKHHPLYIEACTFFINKLMSKKYRNKIGKIQIKLVDSLDYGKSLGNCTEAVWPDGTMDFYIKIANEPITRMVSTMAHEMVHVKQSIKKELIVDGKYWVWKGKRIKYKESWYETFTSSKEYDKLPWEIEAHDLEMTLARSFFYKHFSDNY